MPWLLLVSLVWAFSFGLIKGRLTGLDPALVSLVRVTLALAVFAPLLRPRGLRARDVLTLAAIGAVQFGLMYVFYLAAYRYLHAYEVALWTIFTPLFVCILDDASTRRFTAWPYAAAALATIGAGVIQSLSGDDWKGIALVQLSNACFAAGQVAYRRWRHTRPGVADARAFALLYAGAVLATLPAAAHALPTLVTITRAQWLVLVYLGVVASGLGFFLWNLGATRTSAGLLAVANNAKIPLAVAVSLLVFHETADPVRLVSGGALVVAAGVLADWAERRRGRATA